jgi:AcrR family transcriptional regulator
MRSADPSKAPRIIDSAAQLFAERPYHEVRMDDIAASAGVAKGTLYLHFRDKEALYLALIEDGMRRQLSDIHAHLDDVSDPFDKLRFIVHAVVGFFDKFPYFLELIPSLDAKLRDRGPTPLTGRKQEFLGLVRVVLAEIAETGRLAVTDPEFSSVCLGGLVREVLQSTPRPWPPSIAERIEAQFLHGVRGRPA